MRLGEELQPEENEEEQVEEEKYRPEHQTSQSGSSYRRTGVVMLKATGVVKKECEDEESEGGENWSEGESLKPQIDQHQGGMQEVKAELPTDLVAKQTLAKNRRSQRR